MNYTNDLIRFKVMETGSGWRVSSIPTLLPYFREYRAQQKTGAAKTAPA